MKMQVRFFSLLAASLLLLSGCGSAKDGGLTSSCGSASSSRSNAMTGMAEAQYDSAARGGGVTQGNMGGEEYSSIKENGFHSAEDAPFSTFSADVDTASYSNVRRMLRQGQPVPEDSVRVEEFINYFSYDYPAPNGSDPFSVTKELSDCPWNAQAKLLLVGLQAKDLDYAALPKSNLVFLLDVSGSMNEEAKLPLVKKAFQLLSENLTEDDRVSIVTYAGSDQILLEGVSGENRYEINNALDTLEAGGSTYGSKGIQTAYRIAEEQFIPGGNNRVILATDGDLNVGITSEEGLKRLVEEKRESGVSLSVLGFGTGNLKDNKLETLADWGNGNYAYIDSVLEARRALVEQMGGTLFTVAKDVKLQLEFNPAKVSGYRLVGYENRLLNDEDFQDDEKDAGEIGAGHRVTALYELILADSQGKASQSESDKEKSKEGGSLLTVRVRYKDPESGLAREIEQEADMREYQKTLPQNLMLAASTAEFGMLLRQSEYAGSASFKGILERLSGREDVKSDPYKKEFLELVRVAQMNYEW